MRRSIAATAVAACLVALFAAPARAADHTVHIQGGAPNPAHLTVADGDTVVFVNDDGDAHTIFAAGAPRGDSIPPGGTGDFGPFETNGEGGTFAYQVDDGGASGAIVVPKSATTPPPTTPPTVRPTTTTVPATTTTTTTTTPPTTTSVPATTTTTAPTFDSKVVVPNPPRKKDSSNVLAVLGFALLAAGLGGLVIAVERSRRRRAR